MFPYDLTKMNPNKLLIENYDYNRTLAKALIELYPLDDRNKIDKWIQRLEEMNHTPEQLLYRSHYMWFILLVMQKGQITPPFNRDPPMGQLKPLHEVLPIEIYEDIINSATSQQMNQSWIDKLAAEGKTPEDESKRGLFPCNFFENQPVPAEGAFCYAVVFSDFNTSPDAI
ncbi:uncharacterized protein LOC142328332 [Lycorma delicatula]|uniref:uncharacterized protein LOC142328332 n=1 Tax=Lycorma delicatula TaxID=130591 RepID=UPI003F518549